MPPIQKPIRYSHIKNALADDGGYNKISFFREETLTQTNGTKMTVPSGGAIQLSSFENVETTKSYKHYNQLRLQGSGTGNTNQFGYAVTMNGLGTTIAVGATNDDPDAISNAGRVYIYRGNGALSTFTEEAIIRASDAAINDNFGIALALNMTGNILAVGASIDDHNGFTDRRAVYMFERAPNGVWNEQVRIQGSDSVYDYFIGTALAMDRRGKYIVTGAYNDSTLGSAAGAVNVFERTGTSWQSAIKQTRLLPSDGDAAQNFGWSVAMSKTGNVIAVGANQDTNVKGADAGAVYIFTRSGTDWNQTKVIPDSLIANSYFGHAVALNYDGTVFAASASARQIVYLYKFSTLNGWEFQTQITSPFANAGFGNALHLNHSGNILAVGAPTEISSRGALYVYSQDTSTSAWSYDNKIQASDGGSGDGFGNAIALSGDGYILVTGAYLDTNSSGTNAGSVYLMNALRPNALVNYTLPTSYSEIQKIQASDGQAIDYFANSFAMSSDGSILVIGANNADVDSISDAGCAYIFMRYENTWNEVQKIRTSDAALNDLLGCTVMNEDGSILVMGANADLNGIIDAGSVYIFLRSGNTWNEVQKIQASDAEVCDFFGVSLAINSDGSVLVVGAYLENPNGLINAGSAYIFLRSGNTWNEVQKIRASDAQSADAFGSPVTINRDGSVVVVVAILEDPNGFSNAGSAYIFMRSGNTWNEVQKIRASDAGATDSFGRSVAINSDGSVLVIGADQQDPNEITNAGSVYIFLRSGNTWNEVQQIRAIDASLGDKFGCSVALNQDGSVVVVGARSKYTYGSQFAGMAFIFVRSGNIWNEIQKIQASDDGIQDGFGNAVAMNNDGSIIVIGAQYEDPNNIEDAGSAYIFQASYTDKYRYSYIETQKISASDAEPSDFFGSAVALNNNGTVMAVGAYQEDPINITNAGSVYMYTRSRLRWQELQKIRANDAAPFDSFGQSVKISSDGSILVAGAFLNDLNNITDAGAAYIFSRSGDTWNQLQKLLASDVGATDQFGYSIAMNNDGSIIVIGANYENPNNISDAGSAYVFVRSGNTWNEVQKIRASDAQANDYFGNTIAMNNDGSVFVIGAWYEDPNNIADAGSAYIFLRSGNTWNEVQKIRASDAGVSEFFGASLALNDEGSVLVVGVVREDPDTITDAGSVYIFIRSGNTWNEVQKIRASDAGPSDYLGTSIAINSDGSVLVITAYTEDPNEITDAGSAYIFLRSGNTWNEVQKIRASDAQVVDYFGASLALNNDGSIVVIGARVENPNDIQDAGSAYIFVRSGNTWNEVQKIRASDAGVSDYFGNYVTMNGDGSVIAIGSSLEDPNSIINAGSVYIFESVLQDTWDIAQKIRASDAGISDQFGVSVTMNCDGSVVVVGANLEDPIGFSNAGAAYIFMRSGNTWNEVQKIRASDAGADDYFGISVAINSDGSVIVVGASAEDSNGIIDGGSVFIFLRSGNTWNEVQKIRASDAGSGDYFGYSVAINSNGSVLVVGANGEDPNEIINAGSAYIFLRTGNTWNEVQKIRASDADINDYFGVSVALNSDGSVLVVGAPYEDPNSIVNAGAVYVFMRSGNTWNEVQKIRASDAGASDQFGETCIINHDGSIIVVGALWEDPNTITDAGSVYIFTRSGNKWNELQKIRANDAANTDNFGDSVAMNSDGSLLLVGTIADDINPTTANTGAVYSFKINK